MASWRRGRIRWRVPLAGQALAERRGRRCSCSTRSSFHRFSWGALKAGVVPVPVNTLLVTDVYASILQDSRAVIVFVSEALVPVIMPAIAASDHVTQVVVIGGAPERTVDFDTFIDGAEPVGAIDCSGGEVAF